MSNQFYIRERIPNSPYLNQPFYCVFAFPGLATFTAAYCTIASVISPILATGASYAAFYVAGSVPVGVWNISAHMVKGATGTFVTGTNISIQDSEIAEPVATIYSLINNNLAATYASTLVTTGWHDANRTTPQITVTSSDRTTDSYNLNDTFRTHGDTIYIDTWIGSRDTGAQIFGTTSKKRARKLLDDEVKRIINANRKAPSAKLRWMGISRSQDIPEMTENRRMFRTRHTIYVEWDETIA